MALVRVKRELPDAYARDWTRPQTIQRVGARGFGNVVSVPRARMQVARVVPGYTRAGGFYGRFQQRGRRATSQGEHKFFDTALSFSFDTTTEVPATGQLVLIPQGVTESNRIGRKCNITSILIKGKVSLAPGAAATAATNAYLYVVEDMQTNGAAAAVTDVFTGNVSQSLVRNLANSSRFRILHKEVFSMNPGAGATTALNEHVTWMEWYKKCNIPIEYSSTTGAITEIRSNNIFLVAGSDNGDDNVSFSGVCRVRFIDG